MSHIQTRYIIAHFRRRWSECEMTMTQCNQCYSLKHATQVDTL